MLENLLKIKKYSSLSSIAIQQKVKTNNKKVLYASW